MDGYQRDPQHREELPESGQQPAGSEPPPQQEVPVYGRLDQGYGAQPPQRGRGVRTCLLTCLVVGLLGVLIGAVGCALSWKYIVGAGIDTDLVKYRDTVRASELDEARKQLLIHKIEHLRDRIKEKPMGMMEWISYCESPDKMVNDDVLTPEEADLLEKDLDRIAQALGTQFPPLPEGETVPAPEGGSAVPAPPTPEPF
jgi:hypothetical protein